MKNYFFVLGVLMAGFLTSCSVDPEPINYGKDQCDYCKMGIVDQQHSAQYVTQKGKQFKFDAIECLIHKLEDPTIVESELAHILVADYDSPGVMIKADDSYYIISKAIKSPMGAYLSSFSSKELAQTTIDDNGGELFTWNQIKTKLSKKK